MILVLACQPRPNGLGVQHHPGSSRVGVAAAAIVLALALALVLVLVLVVVVGVGE